MKRPLAERAVRLAALLLFWLPAPAVAQSLPVDRTEPGLLPILANDPDVGFRFGVYGQLVRFRDERRPYDWKLQVAAATSVRNGATGAEFPYREVCLRLDRTRAWIEPLRLTVQAGYLRTTNLGYFGVGNATPAQSLWQGLPKGSDAYVRARHFYQYDAVTPELRATARYRLTPSWSAFADMNVQWLSIGVFAGSLLERDLAAGAPFALGDGVQPSLAMGFIYDTRDHETVATRGWFHEGAVRCGTASGDRYCGANLTLRGYHSLLGKHLSLAGRLVADVVAGRPPLMELTRFGGLEGTTGPGGSRGIRGVPQGRLAGQTKLIANLEVRSFLVPFSLGSQRFELGVAAFADVGRVWARAFSASPADGSFRVHWGAGGGPRLRWGDSLLIRADVAYAPLGADLQAAPAVYLDVLQVM